MIVCCANQDVGGFTSVMDVVRVCGIYWLEYLCGTLPGDSATYYSTICNIIGVRKFKFNTGGEESKVVNGVVCL